MRDSRRIQERVELRFERIHIIWVGLGLVATLAAVFALGLLVGRRSARMEEASVVDPIAQIDADREAQDKLTFYSQLTAAQKELPATALSDPALKVRAKEPPAVVAPAPAPGAETPPAPEKVVVQPPATDTRSPTEQLEAALTARAKEEKAPSDAVILSALASGPPQRGDYTVQVSSFQSMAEAKAFTAALERKGYRPFVVPATIPGKGTWYRVRLGRFSSESQAKEAKNVLAKADIPAWVIKTE